MLGVVVTVKLEARFATGLRNRCEMFIVVINPSSRQV